ncbi:hypothetical protein EVJ58_g8356 [Rhodofomes roseus]|uniref:Uncharacterized protein n=1 Tax=Rhodofomes roseus TaxID=34475 RepID=A0A4Y9Y381_9APHY|nr:hypothetical protein EVJ58_g8356 [Rhodofomes roseus]
MPSSWLGNIKDNEAAQRWAAEMSAISATFDPASVSLKKRRVAVKRMFEEFVELKHGISPDDIWQREDISVYLEYFLSLRAKFTNPNLQRVRRGQNNICFDTLRQWKDVLVYLVFTYHPQGGEMLSGGVYAQLTRHITSIQRELGMERHTHSREGFGKSELQILKEHLYAKTGDAIWVWLIDSRTRIIITLRSVTLPKNVMFDAPLLVILNLLMRGMLYHDTWHAICADQAAEIPIRPEFKAHPLICKGSQRGGILEGQPMRTTSMQELFARIAKQCGFEDARLYNFRHGFAEDMLETFGESFAKDAMGHDPGSNTLRKHYVQETAGKDLVGVRIREAQVSREELNWAKQPAFQANVNVMSTADLAHLSHGASSTMISNKTKVAPVPEPITGVNGFHAPEFSDKELRATDEYQKFDARPERQAKYQTLDEMRDEIEEAIGPIHTNNRGTSISVIDRIAVHAEKDRLEALWQEYKRLQACLGTACSRKRRQIKKRLVEAAMREWKAKQAPSGNEQTTAERLEKAALVRNEPALLQVALSYAADQLHQVEDEDVATDVPPTQVISDFINTAVPDSERGKLDELPTTTDLEGVPLHVMKDAYAQYTRRALHKHVHTSKAHANDERIASHKEKENKQTAGAMPTEATLLKYVQASDAVRMAPDPMWRPLRDNLPIPDPMTQHLRGNLPVFNEESYVGALAAISLTYPMLQGRPLPVFV